VGLDERQTDENTGNYTESDPGRVGNDAILRHMASITATGGHVDNCKLRRLATTTTRQDNNTRLL
jgi:hypothetical protein